MTEKNHLFFFLPTWMLALLCDDHSPFSQFDLGHAQVFTAFTPFHLFKKLEGEKGNKNKTWKTENLTYLTWCRCPGIRVVSLSKMSFGVNKRCSVTWRYVRHLKAQCLLAGGGLGHCILLCTWKLSDAKWQVIMAAPQSSIWNGIGKINVSSAWISHVQSLSDSF